eukprot:CAMPEP_0171458752 /NCGR_PEP_ID=MMETSP0945-20130129/4306_1 /TAXON_ID=109269 /ORGANISM="Vaucheria litorea, Strain CCMP2940" /LENGTH=123 /DNA_ID=CAMNT_0011984625 /DNA_START=372 /DNA_END=740 /DNA_ORIENTATION=+
MNPLITRKNLTSSKKLLSTNSRKRSAPIGAQFLWMETVKLFCTLGSTSTWNSTRTSSESAEAELFKALDVAIAAVDVKILPPKFRLVAKSSDEHIRMEVSTLRRPFRVRSLGVFKLKETTFDA